MEIPRAMKTIIIPAGEEQREVYTAILADAELPEPVVIDYDSILAQAFQKEKTQDPKKLLASMVAKKAGRTPSIIIGTGHYAMTECRNSPNTIDLIFDSHTDDRVLNKHVRFGDSSFLRERRNPGYIIGSTEEPKRKSLKVYSARNADAAIEDLCREQISDIYVSLDLCVFDKKITKAARDSPSLFARWLDGAMGVDRIIDISERALEGRSLVGICLAGYFPDMEGAPYQTARLLSGYLNALKGYLPVSFRNLKDQSHTSHTLE